MAQDILTWNMHACSEQALLNTALPDSLKLDSQTFCTAFNPAILLEPAAYFMALAPSMLVTLSICQ